MSNTCKIVVKDGIFLTSGKTKLRLQKLSKMKSHCTELIRKLQIYEVLKSLKRYLGTDS